MVRSLLLLVLLTSIASGKDSGHPYPPDPDSKSQSEIVRDILDKHCFECHGEKREGDPNYDVLNWGYIVGANTGLVVPGNVEKSKMMQRITSKPVEMPPETRKPLSPEEIKTLSEWIKSGAPAWKTEKRPFIDSKYVSTMIGMDFNGIGEEAKNFRYLSLANLYNDGVSESEIVKCQEAVSKVMNFLAHNKSGCTPTVVLDELGLVVRIDLRNYGWTVKDWDDVINQYPFGDGISFLPADWFCTNVSVPPLYYKLRRIPLTEAELERQLEIKPGSTIRLAGVTDSQVSVHERLFKRYETKDGYYWKTLNVKDGNNSSVMEPEKFKSDYNVSLFTLKNQLFGFAVFQRDEDDPKKFNRKDVVDIDAEFDPTKIVGTPHSTPMLSCVTCHVNGIMNIRDVTGRTAVNFLEPDKKQYMLAAFQASGSTEPLRSVAERYNRPVDMNRASLDSGLSSGQLTSMIKVRKDLISLRPLLEGRTVTRKTWQNVSVHRVTQLVKER